MGTTPEDTDIASDLVFGARAIASVLGMTQRQVYHVTACSQIPTFKIGGTLCARRSTLLAWLERLESPRTKQTEYDDNSSTTAGPSAAPEELQLPTTDGVDRCDLPRGGTGTATCDETGEAYPGLGSGFLFSAVHSRPRRRRKRARPPRAVG